MGLVSKTLANLINGVSQQPATIRNPSQCEAQENCISDVTYGVVHRPLTEFVKTMVTLGASPPTPFVYTIDRKLGSQYKVLISNGDLKVFDLTGVEKTVSFPNGKAYLNSTNPEGDFQGLTLGTETYILNKTVPVVQTHPATSPRPNNEFLVFIKQGDYSTDYNLNLAGSKTNTSIPSVTLYGPTLVTKTTSATVANDIKTSGIAADLKTLIEATTVYTNTLDVISISGSVLWVYTKTNAFPFQYGFQMSGDDSKGNTDLHLIGTAVQKFSDLPTVAPAGYRVRVLGDKTSAYDDYYVVFTVDPNSFSAAMGQGSWAESYGPGSKRTLYPASMPWVLRDNEDGTFTFDVVAWDSSNAGDETTNPSPSFVDKKLSFMFTYGNRLGFLCEDRVIMSEVGEYRNYFLTTVTTFLDSDPIDIQPLQSHDAWLYALPHSEKLVLFSAKGQAVIDGGALLTPKTASLKSTTSFPISTKCPPVVIGDNIYFATDNGPYSRVYEYMIEKTIDRYDGSDITTQVPKYIPSGVKRISGDDGAKLLVAIGSDNTSYSPTPWLYIYKYYWIGDQKVQSSWSRWKLPGTASDGYHVLDVTVASGIAYITVLNSANGDVVFMTMDLDISKIDTGDTLTRTHLDFRLDGSAHTSAPVSGVRTFTLPFDVPVALRSSFKVVKKEQQTAIPRVSWGSVVAITGWSNNHTFTVSETIFGDCSQCWLGFAYASLFTFSEIHLREQSEGNLVPVEEGKLSLRRFSLLYNNTLYMRVEVTPRGRSTRTYVVTPFVVGDPTPLDEVMARTGKMVVPVDALNTQVTISVINDSVVQHRLQSAEWVGQYSILSRRV